MCSHGICQTYEDGSSLLIQTILQPGQTQILDIGIYEANIPTPTLCLKVAPQLQNTIDAKVIKQDNTGDYRLSCKLRNTGQSLCTIIIQECEAEQSSPSLARPIMAF